MNTPSYATTIGFAKNSYNWGQGLLMNFEDQFATDCSSLSISGLCIINVHSKPDGNFEIGVRFPKPEAERWVHITITHYQKVEKVYLNGNYLNSYTWPTGMIANKPYASFYLSN